MVTHTDTNTHGEIYIVPHPHKKNTERGRHRETLRRTNPLPPALNPSTHPFSPDVVVVLIVVAIVAGIVVVTVPAMGGGNVVHNDAVQSLNTANSNNPPPSPAHTQK